MALAVDTASQDRVSRRLLRKAYSAQDADAKAIIDQELTDALGTLKRYAMFLELDDATDAPDEWLGWLVGLASAKGGLVLQPDRVPMLRDEAQREMVDALRLTTRDAVSDDSDGSYAVTAAEVKKYVMGHCVRRSPPLFVAPEDVAAAISAAVTIVWNHRFWDFRRRMVTLTIASDGTVTVSDSVSLDAVATRELHYTDGDSAGIDTIKWVDADFMARLLASGLEAGRPRAYRLEWTTAGGWKWWFAPAPSAEYTCRAEVFTRQAADSAAGAASAIAAMPREIAQLVKPLALAIVLESHGVSGGRQMRDDTMSRLERLGPLYEDHGHGDIDQSVRDVNFDDLAMTSTALGLDWIRGIGGAM